MRELVRPHRGLAALALATLLGAAVGALLVPAAARRPRRRGARPRRRRAVRRRARGRGRVVQAVLTGVGRQLTAKLGETVLAELRERVVERALAIPAARLERGRQRRPPQPRLQRRRGRLHGDPDRGAGARAGGAARRADAVRAGRAEPVAGARGAARGADPAARAAPLPQARRARSTRASGCRRASARSGSSAAIARREDLARARARRSARHEEVETTSRSPPRPRSAAARLQSDRFGRAMNGGELVGLACVLVTGFLLVRAGHATRRRGDRRGALLPPRVRPRRHAVRARRRLPGGRVRARRASPA